MDHQSAPSGRRPTSARSRWRRWCAISACFQDSAVFTASARTFASAGRSDRPRRRAADCQGADLSSQPQGTTPWRRARRHLERRRAPAGSRSRARCSRTTILSLDERRALEHGDESRSRRADTLGAAHDVSSRIGFQRVRKADTSWCCARGVSRARKVDDLVAAGAVANSLKGRHELSRRHVRVADTIVRTSPPS